VTSAVKSARLAWTRLIARVEGLLAAISVARATTSLSAGADLGHCLPREMLRQHPIWRDQRFPEALTRFFTAAKGREQ
jgi:hypothetical protein